MAALSVDLPVTLPVDLAVALPVDLRAPSALAPSRAS
jgi:hypothetical protein